MPSDLVARLRRLASRQTAPGDGVGRNTYGDAADRITALQARNARLEGALKQIAAYPRGGLVVGGEVSGDRDEMIEIARASLSDR